MLTKPLQPGRKHKLLLHFQQWICTSANQCCTRHRTVPYTDHTCDTSEARCAAAYAADAASSTGTSPSVILILASSSDGLRSSSGAPLETAPFDVEASAMCPRGALTAPYSATVYNINHSTSILLPSRYLEFRRCTHCARGMQSRTLLSGTIQSASSIYDSASPAYLRDGCYGQLSTERHAWTGRGQEDTSKLPM